MNRLVFLKQVLDALNKGSSSEIIASYTDFLKVFDKAPQLEILKKLRQIGVRGRILEVLSDYLDQRKKIFVWIKQARNFRITNGVPQVFFGTRYDLRFHKRSSGCFEIH